MGKEWERIEELDETFTVKIVVTVDCCVSECMMFIMINQIS